MNYNHNKDNGSRRDDSESSNNSNNSGSVVENVNVDKKFSLSIKE
jgi:hypothetical protein